MIRDIHSAMKCFYAEPLVNYNQVRVVDNMFPQEGAFYCTHRLLQDELAELDRLEGHGCLPKQPVALTFKRPRRFEAGSSSDDREPPPRRAAQPTRPQFQDVGSFSYAVKEVENSLTILGVKYAKEPILRKLGVKEEDI